MADGDFINMLFERYYNMTARIAFHHTQSVHDAQDIVQTVFLNLIRCEKNFPDEEHAKAYLIRAVINQCRDLHKSACRRLETALSETEGSRATEDPAENIFRQQHVLSAVMQLKPRYRDIVYLYYYENMKIHEIADVLHISRSAAGTGLSRARRQLRQLLGEDGPD